MYTTKLLTTLLLLFHFSGFANNVAITNLKITGQNKTSHFTYVQFDIHGENYWRTMTSNPYNYDAVWIFIKYRIKSTTDWKHATLAISGHTAPSGTNIDTPSDGKGIFIYSNIEGSASTYSLSGIELKWNYGTDGVSDNDLVEIRAYGIEMVYVPQGTFQLGSGDWEANRFYCQPTSNKTYTVSTENAITVGASIGNLYYGGQGDQLGPIPVAFPKGYNAFYCMKYEIGQDQYKEFLNTLTRSQQINRVSSDISGTSVTNNYIMTGTNTVQYRNGIRCNTTIPASPTPVTFYCDFTQDATPDAANDGQNIACNQLNATDVLAYLDWSGLRPLTELEFEKACRGTAAPVPAEYAWGTSAIATHTYVLINGGGTNEGITAGSYSTTVGNALTADTKTADQGPFRQGIFAANSGNTSRVTSGATYYGIMEMSGNVWEQVISVGNPTGRAFTGTHGDGSLDASGNSNVSNWPTSITGIALRGGDLMDSANDWAKVSNRAYGNIHSDVRGNNYGGRGCRTAP